VCLQYVFFFGAEMLHSLLRVYELRLMHALKGKKDGVSFFYYFSYSFTRLDGDVDGTFFLRTMRRLTTQGNIFV
jgi:hypothetical protein